MSIPLSKVTAPVFVRGLTILSTLLAKGAEHAAETRMNPQDLLSARLAPDMLPLSAQVQRASDTSKFAVQRIGGVAAPSFPDDEITFAQLQTRIAKTIAYVQSVDADLLDAGAEMDVQLKWGIASGNFTGTSYLLTIALPNFYFHIVTAYDILRNQGVSIGKLDYLGPFGEL